MLLGEFSSLLQSLKKLSNRTSYYHSVLSFVDQLETKIGKETTTVSSNNKNENSLAFGPANSERFLIDCGSSRSCFMGLGQTPHLNESTFLC